MEKQEIRVDLGPLAAAGLLAVIVGLLRRRPALIALGGFVVASEVNLPQVVRALAARRSRAK